MERDSWTDGDTKVEITNHFAEDGREDEVSVNTKRALTNMLRGVEYQWLIDTINRQDFHQLEVTFNTVTTTYKVIY